MASLTHMVISEHVGTSVEVVSAQMSRLRRLGLVRYSRRYIEIDREAMEHVLIHGNPALGNFARTLTPSS